MRALSRVSARGFLCTWLLSHLALVIELTHEGDTDYPEMVNAASCCQKAGPSEVRSALRRAIE
jgi:hypothetical protein